MDGWDTEDLDDYPGEFDDSEYSGEAARRALRRRGGGRAPGRLVPTTQGRAAMERTRRLEAMQKRNAVQQSSDTFGPMATAAAGAFALATDKNAYLQATLTHALPIAQILTSSRGRAIGAAFRANPVVSLGFPIAALAIGLLRDRIPGLAPVKVDRPVARLAAATGRSTVREVEFLSIPPGATLKYRISRSDGATPAPEPGEPTDLFDGSIPLNLGDCVKLIAMIGDARSEPILLRSPLPPP